jgi:hypothetical protein
MVMFVFVLGALASFGSDLWIVAWSQNNLNMSNEAYIGIYIIQDIMQ